VPVNLVKDVTSGAMRARVRSPAALPGQCASASTSSGTGGGWSTGTHGLGKPEPLKHLGGGVWSRRLSQEHRFAYRVAADRIDFLQARYHY
jgi:hypothetical protein